MIAGSNGTSDCHQITCSGERCCCCAASRLRELDSQIAQVDQELATKTRYLLKVEEEAEKAHREEIDMKAQVTS